MNSQMTNPYFKSLLKPIEKYRVLAEKTFSQLSEEELFKPLDQNGNSIGILVQHLRGNMRSRWTDFMTTDGEKEWRQRDAEFEGHIQNREELLKKWREGWGFFYKALDRLQPEDLEKTVYIRDVSYSVYEAIHLQLAHCMYHIGQIVLIGKTLKGDQWENLSIPKGKSEEYFDRESKSFPESKPQREEE